MDGSALGSGFSHGWREASNTTAGRLPQNELPNRNCMEGMDAEIPY